MKNNIPDQYNTCLHLHGEKKIMDNGKLRKGYFMSGEKKISAICIKALFMPYHSTSPCFLFYRVQLINFSSITSNYNYKYMYCYCHIKIIIGRGLDMKYV